MSTATVPRATGYPVPATGSDLDSEPVRTQFVNIVDFLEGGNIATGNVNTSEIATLGTANTWTGNQTLNATLTVGADDAGYDVRFYGATSGKSMLWDESADTLIVTGAQTISETLGVTGVATFTAQSVHTGGIQSGSNIVSDTDSTDDLGTNAVRWANLYVDDITTTTSAIINTMTIATGSITDSTGAIDFGNENLSTTGTLSAGATTVTSLSVSDGNITNVGDIALDTISSDSGSTITVNLGTDAGDDFIIGSDLFRIGGDNGNIGIGADAGTTASIYMQKPEDQRMLYLNATNATYASEIQRNMSARAANSAYNFLICYSNNGSDTEFNFRGDGEAFADGSFTGSGADYQEYFESTDGSALTVGKVVVLDGGKVRYYNSGTDNADDIIGVVRPKTPNKNSAVRGNAAWNFWTEKYLTDDYGRYVMETYSVYEWTDDDGVYSYPTDQVPNDVTVPNDAETVTTDGNGVTLKRRKLNPNYDPDLAYTPRHDRDEWNLIGLLGQVQIANGETVNSRWVSMGAISGSVNLYYIR